MSKEKLTVDLFISGVLVNYNNEEYIQNAMQKNRDLVYRFLKQIRDELYKSLVESDAGFSETAFQKVFDKYIK